MAAATAADGGGGGGGGETVTVPADRRRRLATTYAQKVAGEGLVPEIRRELSNEAKGTLLRVDPEENTEVDAGSTVAVIVSAGAPLLAFDDDEDILVVDSGTGKQARPDRHGDRGGEGSRVELRRQLRAVHQGERRPGHARRTASGRTRRRSR